VPGSRADLFCRAPLPPRDADRRPAGGQAGQGPRGAYYFDGWTGTSNHLTPRLREEFFDREPVWDWRDDSLPVVEEQIACAADHGLSFFAFDWYWPEGPEKETPLNTGLKLYLQAGNKPRLEFCLLVANHGGFRIDPADWDTVTDLWVRLFKEPTHVKVEGRPLLILFTARELRHAFGSSAAVKAAERANPAALCLEREW
jgi:hypothetical protein